LYLQRDEDLSLVSSSIPFSDFSPALQEPSGSVDNDIALILGNADRDGHSVKGCQLLGVVAR